MSVSEWRLFHSLTLAATTELKRVEGNWHEVVRLNAPGIASGMFTRSFGGNFYIGASSCPAKAVAKADARYALEEIATNISADPFDP